MLDKSHPDELVAPLHQSPKAYIARQQRRLGFVCQSLHNTEQIAWALCVIEIRLDAPFPIDTKNFVRLVRMVVFAFPKVVGCFYPSVKRCTPFGTGSRDATHRKGSCFHDWISVDGGDWCNYTRCCQICQAPFSHSLQEILCVRSNRDVMSIPKRAPHTRIAVI